MFFFHRRASSRSSHVFTFVFLLSAVPIVHADYLSVIWQIQQAFFRFTIPIPRSAAPEEARLDLHYDQLYSNYTKYDNATVSWLNGEIEEDEWHTLTDEAAEGMEYSWYQLIADYMGVGVQRSCRGGIEAALDGATEWDRAGQQAASLIMALLPSLLTFGNLYVPRSSEAFGTSFLVGFLSAVFGFGLPVKSISAVPVKQTVTLSRLSWKALSDIGKLGQLDGKKPMAAKLPELQRWSDDRGGRMSTADRCFAGISHAALDWKSRTHWWHLPSLLIASCQTVILLLCVFPLFMGHGVPQLLFDCTASITSVYLLVSAVVSSVTRFLMWETSSHERVHIYALSEAAEKQLRKIAKKIPPGLSTEKDLPPLQAPLLIRPIESIKRNVSRLFFAFTRVRRSIAQQHHQNNTTPAPANTPLYTSDTRYWMIPFRFVRVLLTRFRWIFTNTITFFLSGFRNHNAAIRWRPLIVLTHLSTTGRNPLKTLFTGVVEGSVLLVLTFFFSAQWAGNLIVTMYSVAYLLVAVSAARGLGLAYIRWSVRSAGLHVVECESVDEIYGSLRVLCSMKHLLVRVNGAWYFEGRRMGHSPEYWDWELRSERGEFDDEKRVLGVSPAPASAGRKLPPKAFSSPAKVVASSVVATIGGGPGPNHRSTI